jgi:hypothetical protein
MMNFKDEQFKQKYTVAHEPVTINETEITDNKILSRTTEEINAMYHLP